MSTHTLSERRCKQTMAIEFNCPYCTAVIRASGDAAGKIGRCPKCETRLRVPAPPPSDTVPPDAASPATSAPGKPKPPPPPEQGFDAIDLHDLPAQPPAGAQVSEAAGREADAVFIPDVPEPEVNPLGSLIETADASEPVYQRVKRSRQRNWTAILAPLVCGGILVAAGFIYWWTQRETMTGELTGERLPADAAPSAVIQRFVPDVSTEIWQASLTGLRDDPVIVQSELMVVEFRGSRRGIEVSVSAGPETTLVRVDVRRNRLLNEFCVDQSQLLDEDRAAELKDASTRFLEDWFNASNSGMLMGNGAQYRDSAGLNALTRGLGYHSVALVGNTLYPCVHEDSEGRLYFALPHDVDEFVVTERQFGDRESVFPQEYRFTVTIGSAPQQPATDDAEPETELDEAPVESPEGETDAEPNESEEAMEVTRSTNAC